MASDGDGKKRRSFLPAPKKTSAIPFTAPQATFSDGMLQAQSSVLPLVSTVFSNDVSAMSSPLYKAATFSSIRDQATAQHQLYRHTERIMMDRQIEKCAFGTGLRVGARVLIGGIKPGVLRYLGTTHMARGIFCGIELLDPDGNHDGEVNGHRYFTCAPNHGIFAPKEKVCLDTSTVLGRLESNLDLYYSNSESPSERARKAFRSYDRECEQVYYSSENLVPPNCTQYTQDFTSEPHYKNSRYSEKINLPFQFSIGSGRPSESLESKDLKEPANRATKSGLPRAGTSIVPTPSLQSKLSAVSRTHNIFGNDSIVCQRQPSYSSESEISVASSLEVVAKNQRSITDYDTDLEYGRFSPRYRQPRESSSGGSEDDEFLRDTFSKDIKGHLRSDSKQYLNFNLDSDNLSRSLGYEDSELVNSLSDKDLSIVRDGAVNRWNFDRRSQNVISDNTCGNFFPALTAVSSTYMPGESIKAGTTGVFEADTQPLTSFLLSGCSEKSDVSNSDSYTLLRNIHDHSETSKDDFNLSTTHTVSSKGVTQEMRPVIDDSGGDGLSADFHTCDDDRIIKDNEIHEKGGKQDQSADVRIPSQLLLKTVDEDDSTGNTEDERIEADQVYGQDSKQALGIVVDGSLECHGPFKEDHVNDGDSREKHQSVDTDTCADSVSNAVEDNEDNEDESVQQCKTRVRKPVTITKKRSENVDHKMPNTNVTSRLADYIKAPIPVKSKEEKEKDQKKKQNKNVKNTSQNRMSLTEISNSKLDSRRPSSNDRDDNTDETAQRYKAEIPEKLKPVIKKTPRKSKWDEIMSQIEANKDTAKPKPMSEIKSSLAAYLNTPPPQLPAADTDSNTDQHKREFKSKIKQLPPPPPKIDFSKIKSKLNVPTAASAIKAMPKREHIPKLGKAEKGTSRGTTAAASAESAVHSATEDNRKMSDGSIVLIMEPVIDEAIAIKSSDADASVCEPRDSSAGPPTTGGIASKGDLSLLDLNKKGNQHTSGQSLTIDKARSASDQLKTPVENQKKVTQAPSHQSQKSRASSTIKVTSHTNSNIRTRGKLTSSAALKEIERLESLCEARTEEVTHIQMQLTVTIQAFDAMAALLNYSCNELKAFEGLTLQQKLDAAEKQLADCVSQIADLSSLKEKQNTNLIQSMQEKDEANRQTKEALDSVEKEKNEHSRLTHDLNNTHSSALTTQREELSAKYDDTMKKLTQFYERQIELLRQDHERQVANITNEGKLETNSLKISHLEEIQELRNRHDDQMEELHKQHRNKIDDITLRFEAIRLSLSEKVDSLRKECDDLARRARDSEDALQRDADVKVQIALSPYLNLPSEIESLKSVQEMRIQEIQKLRNKILDLEKQLEEIPIARDKIISMQQKVDNLEAIISIKIEHEKQLHNKCQVLMCKYERESRANKRISMDFEQVMWRMSQSSEFGSSESLSKPQFSRSSSRGVEESPDTQGHVSLPSGQPGDGILRVRKRSSNSTSESDRKVRSRSATFLTGRNESSDRHSPSLSPQIKQKKRSKKYHGKEFKAESGEMDRMCYSAGPEILYDLLSDTSSQQTQCRMQNETTLLTDLSTSQTTSSSDMASSYARSLSGVTDSGVYDCLARSDVLNSSMASTDSEWGNSANLLITCKSTGEDFESGPTAGDYLSLDAMTETDIKGSSP